MDFKQYLEEKEKKQKSNIIEIPAEEKLADMIKEMVKEKLNTSAVVSISKKKNNDRGQMKVRINTVDSEMDVRAILPEIEKFDGVHSVEFFDIEPGKKKMPAEILVTLKE